MTRTYHIHHVVGQHITCPMRTRKLQIVMAHPTRGGRGKADMENVLSLP